MKVQKETLNFRVNNFFDNKPRVLTFIVKTRGFIFFKIIPVI